MKIRRPQFPGTPYEDIGVVVFSRSALGELEAPARLGPAVLLALSPAATRVGVT